jgi:hypothetical protein
MEWSKVAVDAVSKRKLDHLHPKSHLGPKKFKIKTLSWLSDVSKYKQKLPLRLCQLVIVVSSLA